MDVPTSNWNTEFTEDYAPPHEIVYAVSQGVLRDLSWHNDVSPCFAIGENSDGEPIVRLWSDSSKQELRESESSNRFHVFVLDNELAEYAGNDAREAIRAALAAFVSNIPDA
jgi:hypothetical protein